MPKLLIVTSQGPDDATSAGVPFRIAANGAGTSGVSCGVALAGDAVELMKPDVQARVRGIGIPSARF